MTGRQRDMDPLAPQLHHLAILNRLGAGDEGRVEPMRPHGREMVPAAAVVDVKRDLGMVPRIAGDELPQEASTE